MDLKLALHYMASDFSKLSMSSLHMLPEGLWLRSNTMYCWEEPIHQADGEEKYLKYYSPFYLEQIAPIPARQEQWARIKKANANHRSFSLFSSKEEACEDISLLGSYKDLEERGDAAWSDCFISNIDAEKLNAEIWQLTLLEFNPEFIGWELGEDREWVKRNRWDREFYFDTWKRC